MNPLENRLQENQVIWIPKNDKSLSAESRHFKSIKVMKNKETLLKCHRWKL